MKNVSCASLAGCDCGWKRASKFQKELSTHLEVGISSNPISIKMRLNSALTLSRGWKLPPTAGAPMASRFTGLKPSSLQCVPGAMSALFPNMALVKSATLRTRTCWNSAPLERRDDLRVICDANLRFLRPLSSSSCAATAAASPSLTARSASAAVSTTLATRRTSVSPSFLIHLFFMHCPTPTLAASPSALCTSLSAAPSAGTALNTCTSGAPHSATFAPSSVSVQ
mmetsp:Transcript_2360/g.5542  ORF Transcript_2360/g.5542 Transcript_2360/m.5542 type:complete len:226 (-) Transcript_2360:546-1223(-)